MKIHLIDGTYELFRAHFGAPPRDGADGRPVGAAYGLLRSLGALLREPDVTHAAVAFDHVIESFRNRLYPGYKSGEGVPVGLRAQFGLAEEVAGALGIVVWPMVEHEADDALATAAARWVDHPEVEQIVLCSPDKDLAQCVRGRKVVCLDRRRERLLDEVGVRERFGIGPASIPDWLALVGDSADGLPGLPRWGERSTSAVLARYEHIEAIPADPEGWQLKVRGAKGLAASLAAGREDALLFRRLATLAVDVPLAQRLDDLRWRGPSPALLEELGPRLGDSRLVQRYGSIG